MTICALIAFSGLAVGATHDLSGMVVETASMEGIASAKVRLKAMSSGEVVAEGTTGEDGQFVLSNVSTGWYSIGAEREGYSDLLQSSRSTRTVYVSGSGIQRVTVALTRISVISGAVVDTAGKPVRGIRVVAVPRRLNQSGFRFAMEGREHRTDDRGYFRIFDLPPGHYTVAVVPEGGAANEIPFAPVYFPGVLEPERAEFFALRPGEVRGGTNLSLLSVARHEIRGSVSGIPLEWKGRQFAVAIFALAGLAPLMETVQPDDDGRFTLRGIPPGKYQIAAWGPLIGWGPKGGLPGPDGRQGSMQIDVGSGDLEGVVVPLQDVAMVEGELEVEGGPSVTKACSTGAQLSLRPLDPLPEVRLLTVTLTGQGVFAVREVPIGRFHVELRGLRPPCFLHEVLVAGQRAPERVISIAGDIRLVLGIGINGGTVAGKVFGPNDKPESGAVVILLSASGSHGRDFEDMRTIRTDERGQFRLEQVPPGTYFVLAVHEPLSPDILDPLFWKEKGVIPIEVRPAGIVNTTLGVMK